MRSTVTVNGRVGSCQTSQTGSDRFEPVETDQTSQNRFKTGQIGFPAAHSPCGGACGTSNFNSAESLTAPPPHAPPSTVNKVDTVGLATTQGTRWCRRCRKRNNDRVCFSLDDEHNGSFKTTIGIRTASGSKSKTGVGGREFGSEWVACSVGANFTPHIITVNSGEGLELYAFSASGVISSVTLSQPDSSGGTLTYEGRFEILSLSGSFMPNDTGATRSRSGGMSVSLASPDGRVVGGGVAGLLVADGPVQVVVGSFLAGNQHEPKLKKQKHESFSVATPVAAIPVSSADKHQYILRRFSILTASTNKAQLMKPHSRVVVFSNVPIMLIFA
ncbi:AT-hook motif nuclear-localized protein 2 [Hibiscus syriacus]|uniref:AT-hook motif nuclear-localized protein n=1 Tax=Hibiscus syriacus TaxID=106335 RepID=A0A6A3CYI2_HIBSY|nr:AT-hook motif nuclear-localized protein 2 [Hibiscus syriacus]